MRTRQPQLQQVKRLQVEFRNIRGLTLRGVLYEPQKYSRAVLYAHGFPGDSSGGGHRACSALARAGVLAMRFDFTGCGASDGKHEERLMSRDVHDIRAAMRFLCTVAPHAKIVLLGHSTGAIDAALYAHTDKRLAGLIISGGVACLDRAAHYDFTDRQVREFWTRGYTKTLHAMRWSGKRERIEKQFYDEFFTLNISRALKRYHKPLLVIHGERDEAVPLAEGKELFALAHKPKRLVVIRRADHRFKKNSSTYYAALVRFVRSV